MGSGAASAAKASAIVGRGLADSDDDGALVAGAAVGVGVEDVSVGESVEPSMCPSFNVPRVVEPPERWDAHKKGQHRRACKREQHRP